MILNGLIFIVAFFFALFLFAIVGVVVFVLRLRRRLGEKLRRGGFDGSFGQGRPFGDDSAQRGQRHTTGDARTTTGGQCSTTGGDGVRVVDTRPEEKAKRKIFDSTDGEYVDYVSD